MSDNTETAWAPYAPSTATPWNLSRVVHLYRRAAFAAPWPQLQRGLQEGPRRTVDRLLRGEPENDGADNFQSLARTIGEAATASGSPGRLKAWWLYRMLMSPDPLGERLSLMWHNHFATSNRKVQDLVQMRAQNDLFRKHARAPFGQLLEAVVKHPSILLWLDADSNRRGHPNENLARELMELFTLGIGHYTEDDVKEAARALTGWTVKAGRFAFRDARHDSAEKRVLGRRGKLNGDDLVSLVLEHPATARRLAWRICRTFMGEEVVDETALAELADGLRSHELNIGWAVETVLRSQLFFSDRNLRARVTGPAEFVVGTLRALELRHPPPSTLLLADWTARMGQDLFYPPNVGGWKEGRAWLSTQAIVARANYASALAEGRLWHPTRPPDFEELLKRHSVPVNLDSAATWLGNLLWGSAPQAALDAVIAATKSSESARPVTTALALMMARPEHFLA